VTPARVADSRVNQQIIGAVPASGTATVQVTGHGGLPAVGVAAVVLNVTVVAPQAPGYVTVWPTGIAQTNTSNLNFGAGQNIPNTVIVPVGVDGKISLFNGSAGSAHLLVDVTGYTLAGPPPAVTAITPTSGSTSGGTVVTVTGTLLTGATTVTFGGTAGTALTVLSDTQLRITSPRHPAGPVDIQVTTPGGTSAATAADNYTYVPAGVQLSPTVTIADGRAASTSRAELTSANASAFLFPDGTVRFGTNYARVATIRGNMPTIVGTKVVTFENSYQDPTAIVFSDLDGSNRQRFTKPADGVIIAATPNGWLESVVAADGSSVSLRRATIGLAGAVSRTTIGVMNTAPAGLTIIGVSVNPKNTDQITAFTLATRYSNNTYVSKVMRLKYATNELTTLATDVEGLAAYSWNISAVNNGDVTLSSTYHTINATRRVAANGTVVTWTFPYNTYAVADNAGTAVWTEMTPTYQIGRSFRGNADGTTTEIPSPWWVTHRIISVGTDVYYTDPARGTIKTTSSGTPETLLFGLSTDPLHVTAVDITAGKVAWIDNSKAGTPHAAWRRDLGDNASTRTLVLDRATGVSIAQAFDSTFVLQENADPQVYFPDLVKVSAAGQSIVANSQTWSDRIQLSATGNSLLANRFRGHGGLSSIFDVNTAAVTELTPPPSVDDSMYALSDQYLVRTDTTYPTTPGGAYLTTITAKDTTTEVETVVGSIPSYPTGKPVIAGHSAVISSGTQVYWVDLANPGAGLQNFSLAGARIVASHETRFAVSDANALIGVYTVGQRTPDFTVQSIGPVYQGVFDFDNAWVVWTQDTPDGDRLVGARVPGTTG